MVCTDLEIAVCDSVIHSGDLDLEAAVERKVVATKRNIVAGDANDVRACVDRNARHVNGRGILQNGSAWDTDRIINASHFPWGAHRVAAQQAWKLSCARRCIGGAIIVTGGAQKYRWVHGSGVPAGSVDRQEVGNSFPFVRFDRSAE